MTVYGVEGDEDFVYRLTDLDPEWNSPIQLTDEEAADYARVLAEFKAWQKRLGEAEELSVTDATMPIGGTR